jgi:hypothetical protein
MHVMLFECNHGAKVVNFNQTTKKIGE